MSINEWKDIIKLNCINLDWGLSGIEDGINDVRGRSKPVVPVAGSEQLKSIILFSFAPVLGSEVLIRRQVWSDKMMGGKRKVVGQLQYTEQVNLFCFSC